MAPAAQKKTPNFCVKTQNPSSQSGIAWSWGLVFHSFIHSFNPSFLFRSLHSSSRTQGIPEHGARASRVGMWHRDRTAEVHFCMCDASLGQGQGTQKKPQPCDCSGNN